MKLHLHLLIIIISISIVLLYQHQYYYINHSMSTTDSTAMLSSYHSILSDKHVLLTGGAGYIGSHIAVELLNSNARVTIADNLCNSNIEVIKRIEKITNKSVRFIHVDLLHYHELESLVFMNSSNSNNNTTYDSVIHLAALKAVGESTMKPLLYYENNLVGTINLLKLCDKYKLYNIVFSSSATVYGTVENNPITESASLGSTNPYGQTKYVIELMLCDLAAVPNSLYKIVLLRYFNPIGAHSSGLIGEDPTGPPNNLLPYVAQVASGRVDRPYVQIYGTDYPTRDGTGIRDYIHIIDLARGHLAALAHGIYGTSMRSNCEAYNLGTGTGYSVLEVIDSYSRAANKSIPTKITARRTGDVAECYADPTKANKELQWVVTHTLQQACDSSFKWQSMNPNGYNTNTTDNNSNELVI